MIARFLLILFAALALIGCQGEPAADAQPGPLPAIWEARGPDGAVEGWLFGTIHALPDGVAWRSELLDGIVDRADMLVVEVAGLEDCQEMARAFADLAFDTPGPALAARIDPRLRARMDEMLGAATVRRDQFDGFESWAAALSLAQLARTGKTENGVDKALLREFDRGAVVELEGAAAQLAIFDGLPEADQRDLLDAVIAESRKAERDAQRLVASWSGGDLPALEELTTRGMLADPELYEALLARRNRAWAGRIEDLMSAPGRPLIAVGAGHMVGADGLPALLATRGYTITRVQ